MSNEIPRRNRLDQNTPAELAIRAAVDAVEALPADVRLTGAVVLLQQARELVADYVDGVERRKAVARPPTMPLSVMGRQPGFHPGKPGSSPGSGTNWAARLMGGFLACTEEMRVRFPRCPPKRGKIHA